MQARDVKAGLGAAMEGFEELLRMYRQSLPEKRALLEHEWRAVREANEAAEATVQALRRQLHNLSGSGGAYGFEAMGEMARTLEKRWVQWLALPLPRPVPRRLADELAPLLHALLDALEAAALPADEGGEHGH